MYRWTSRTFAMLGLLVAAACSRFDAANLATEFEGQVESGLVFNLETKQALDIYRPDGPGPHPVMVFWYGGSWQSGSRADYRFVGVEMAKRGFVTVLPDYRKYPAVTYPAFVEDAADAFAWVRRNISEYGGDPSRIIVSGHSAGAHSAVMLATDQRLLARRGLSPSAIRGVIGLAGPYHFTPESRRLVKAFNGPENFPAMQAGNFVDGDEPPMVLLHGSSDVIVNRINIDRLTAALDRTDGCYQTRFYPEVGHVGIVAAFTWAYPTEPIVPDIAAFARQLADGTLCEGPQS